VCQRVCQPAVGPRFDSSTGTMARTMALVRMRGCARRVRIGVADQFKKFSGTWARDQSCGSDKGCRLIVFLSLSVARPMIASAASSA
jgi:hypothetical protein